jgi:UDP-N-acetylglucosamine 2-epimerase (non-hydrolysing)
MKILLCFGTRPEAVKMAPLYQELKKNNFEVKVCVTAQHREMLDQVLVFFEITPDYDLDLMQPNQTLNGLSANILFKIDEVLTAVQPDLVFVHGDTTTSSMVVCGFSFAWCSGAGLRTYRKSLPEEINRQIVRITDIHFTLRKLPKFIEEFFQLQLLKLATRLLTPYCNKENRTNGYFHHEIEMLKILKKKMVLHGHRRRIFFFCKPCEALYQCQKEMSVAIVLCTSANVKDIVYEKNEKDNIYLLQFHILLCLLMQQSF